MARDAQRDRRSLPIYASSERTFRDDLESLIAAVSGRSVDYEPTKVVGRVDVDALEAHAGAIKRVHLYEPDAQELAPQVPVPPKAHHLDHLSVGPDEVAIVRIVPPRDRLAVRAAAFAALVLAIGFLLFLLAL